MFLKDVLKVNPFRLGEFAATTLGLFSKLTKKEKFPLFIFISVFFLFMTNPFLFVKIIEIIYHKIKGK